MFADCDCPDPNLCKTLKRHISGRLWEIWNEKGKGDIVD